MTSPTEHPSTATSPTQASPAAVAGESAGALQRAQVIGTGLIGASLGMALRRAGWFVTGTDQDESRVQQALDAGAVDAIGRDPSVSVTFVATPVGSIVSEARKALAGTTGVVTDVGGVKARIVAEIDDPRFLGGHPMAGSEQEGVDGADADLFRGATWVLTPTPATDLDAYTTLRGVLSSLGADVVAVEPARHDALVAVVSHVPHLTAAALMGLAAESAEQHATLLRLAAGGFRDMTRIAAGHPGIWPDICVDNATAIVEVLDTLGHALAGLRDAVLHGDRSSLLAALERAREARMNLPGRSAGRPQDLVEARVPVPDRPGVLADVTTLCSELGVNIEDLEIAHSSEGDRGVLVMVVGATSRDVLRGGLVARGYRPAFRALG
jgi:prephenate dehydrogenase